MSELDGLKIPQHVSIILDGNGRWAKSKGMPRTYGHTMGAKNIEQICMDADDIGIKYLTVYAFSTENWNRPSSEVAALMRLLNFYLKTIGKKAMKIICACVSLETGKDFPMTYAGLLTILRN